jgi:hypothetical protein
MSPYITPPLRHSVPMRRAWVSDVQLVSQSETHSSEVHSTDVFGGIGMSPIVLRD